MTIKYKRKVTVTAKGEAYIKECLRQANITSDICVTFFVPYSYMGEFKSASRWDQSNITEVELCVSF